MIRRMLMGIIFSVEGKLRRLRAKVYLCREVNDLLRLARYIHHAQINPYSGAPQWFHFDDVLFDLRRFDRNSCINMQCAAILHESLQVVTEYELRELLVPFKKLNVDQVVGIIKDLEEVYTEDNYPELSENDRMILERRRQQTIPRESRLILICDFRCLLKTLIKHNSKLISSFVTQFGPIEEALPFL